ncbi:Hypothetical protein FKW44_020606 [Caligus rogercresseyi]|uniref:Uncharacterized protein n=1 Tax=Caligus rogercresseyi TaxID=217165 RepID=A0A7T8JZN9_CALRO|nr:Hypothetical protein FKW44_020606 [Caligus rogercresseyi]
MTKLHVSLLIGGKKLSISLYLYEQDYHPPTIIPHVTRQDGGGAKGARPTRPLSNVGPIFYECANCAPPPHNNCRAPQQPGPAAGPAREFIPHY